jgi:hypothetical protein
LPLVLRFLGESDLGEDAADILGDEVVDRFGRVIERGDGGHDDGSGLLRAKHVFEMDAIERRLADAEDELAAFLEANIGGAGKEVVAQAAGDGGESADRAGNDDHGVHGIAAGGDGRADVFIGEEFDLGAGLAEQKLRQLFCVRGDDAEFVGAEAESGVCDDEMDAGDARVGFEEAENGLREYGAGVSGDTDGDGFGLGGGHGQRGRVSLGSGERQSQEPRRGSRLLSS